MHVVAVYNLFVMSFFFCENLKITECVSFRDVRSGVIVIVRISGVILWQRAYRIPTQEMF
jgi:hypothetical protein